MVEFPADNTPNELLAVLAFLALDELDEMKRARVEERYQLVAEGMLPAASWLASRFAERARSSRSVAAA
jgi:hypothetical protein